MASTLTAPDRPQIEDPDPLRSNHTPNFPALLLGLGASLPVTTYQAGKLVIVRDEGDQINVHFRTFQAPMGLALRGGRLAIGTTIQVGEYVDAPAVTAKLDPPDRHDACFLPRASHPRRFVHRPAPPLHWQTSVTDASRSARKPADDVRFSMTPRSIYHD
jgi:Domain of unknown function (DUF4915)